MVSAICFRPFWLLLLCFLTPQLGHGAPIQVPDLRKCSLSTDKSVAGPPETLTLNCCLAVPKKILNFSFHEYASHGHVRRPAHKLSKNYIKKYKKAYKRMKALPSHDPRSFANQAALHCAFCNGAYKQLGTNITLDVHFSWLFLPWHRWYLYFHERILAKLIGDPTFSLAFWNWDDQQDGGNVIPAMFAKNGSSLYDAKRNPSHLPPYLVRLSKLSNTTNNSVVINENLNQMYQAMVTASTAELFMGKAYRVGVDDTNSTVLSAPIGGSVENTIHNAVHFFTGDPRQKLLQDMGTFSTASRDPIFYAHHSNVDRLWDAWTSIPGGRRQPHTDPDFLEAEFVFYDEHANAVKVKVKDALSSEKLGVYYEPVEADKLWLNFSPQSVSNGTAINITSDEPIIGPASANSTSIELGKKLVAWVKLPSKPSAEFLKSKGVKTEAELEQVLVIQSVDMPRDTFIELVVFVNMPSADDDTDTSIAEFVGGYSSIAQSGKPRHTVNVKLEIRDNLKKIGLQNEEFVLITIVVKAYNNTAVDVKFKGMEIEWE